MKKKIYTMPHIQVVEIETQFLLTGSQIDVSVNNPTDEVDAGEALSRSEDSVWNDFEED